MDHVFILSLSIYSGKENPIVYISEAEFQSILSSLNNQQKLSDCNFIPNLGEVGFSLYSSSISIYIYPKYCTIETNSTITYSLTTYNTFKKTYDSFFRLYKGIDFKNLASVIKDGFSGLAT